MMLDGRRVLLSRRDLNMNQDVLADRVGVSQSYISGVERGKITNPTLSVVRKLAEALEVSPAYLLDLSDDPLGGDRDAVIFVSEDADERALVSNLLDELRLMSPEDRHLALSLVRQVGRSRNARIIGS